MPTDSICMFVLVPLSRVAVSLSSHLSPPPSPPTIFSDPLVTKSSQMKHLVFFNKTVKHLKVPQSHAK